jgi:endonuclease/exonuclease/phosphatase (EEP) superfamily protein YafD
MGSFDSRKVRVTVILPLGRFPWRKRYQGISTRRQCRIGVDVVAIRVTEEYIHQKTGLSASSITNDHELSSDFCHVVLVSWCLCVSGGDVELWLLIEDEASRTE